ncbi:IS110 family transposase, partial [Pseudooceanicola sp.]|uniref:IS110 family transposase n=1 Tax=Pseudooceanicola sp. TaxID=1914328 RepID=UPI0040596C8C
MLEIITVGLDLAKNVFQVHGADGTGRAALCKKLRRAQVLEFFSQLPPCVVAMEACGGAHFWGREISKLSHAVRLIPPAYVKPFVKRQKNDAADAEAICEAALRPTMRFVPVKSEETQGAAMVFRVRELLIRQRTQAINALRGHLSEFGQVVPQGAANASKRIAIVEDPTSGLPADAIPTLKTLRECPDLCVSGPVHAVSDTQASKRSPNIMANWLRAANHSRTFLPSFS